ncbi:MAG: major capsid protein [Firmicutes bacterium]|nr:major capsid protein [Bacillota bacterium]
MKNILDLIDQKKLLAFVRALEPDNTNLWSVLFPYLGTDELKAEYLKGAYNAPVVMTPTAFESEAEMGSREGLTKVELELIKFARKMRLNEEEIRKTLQPRTGTADGDAAVRQVYNDAETLYNAADVTREKMAMDAASTGKVILRDIECDFGVPADQKVTLTTTAKWDQTDTRDPLKNELDWIDVLVEANRRLPERALTTRKVLNYLLQDAKYREAYWGKPIGAVDPPVLTNEQFNQVRTDRGLPPIKTYDRVARVQNEDGTYTTIRLLAQNKFILLPGGKLGDTLHGIPTEALYNNELTGSEKQGVYTYNYSEHEPPSVYTKTVMFAFPTFPEAEHVFQADVF